MNTVKLNGSNYLRQRIILATLSGKSLKITKIRESESNPGVTEEEMNLLRLVERPVSSKNLKVKSGASSRWSSSLYCPMCRRDSMTFDVLPIDSAQGLCDIDRVLKIIESPLPMRNQDEITMGRHTPLYRFESKLRNHK